ncbi:MAG: PIG-L family deacetylase [Mycobacterium sp.]
MHIHDAVLVVAHPDDEILWFSSVLNSCKRVVACFGPSATSAESWDTGRAALMENYPLTKARFLKVRQSNAFEAANWKNPTESDSGLHLRRRQTRASYTRNAREIRRLLEGELNQESLVFTHNPWGEYGNEEHVQVFRIVMELKDKLGFELFVNGYVSNRSVKLMSRCAHSLGGNPVTRETDTELAHRLKQLYQENDCWTWLDDYEWPRYESFYRITQPTAVAAPGSTSSLPLNYIAFEFNQSQMRKLASRLLPTSVKSQIKRLSKLV